MLRPATKLKTLLCPILLVFDSPSELLAWSNDYMDKLEGKAPRSKEEALERTKMLASIVSDMRRFNFHAPKFGVGDLFKELRFSDKEELLEAAPLLQSFIYSLNSRKWAYERAKIAFLANKLAYYLLKEEVMEEFIPYLPYGGDYLSFTLLSGGAGYLAFRDIEKLLKGEKRLSLVFEEERLVGVEKEGKKGLLPSSTATLLASLAVKMATERHWRDIVEAERSRIPHYDEILAYESIVSRYDVVKVSENPELYWSLFQELEEAGFLDEDGSVKPHILNGLRKKRFFRYNRLLSLSQSYLTLFLLQYYLYFVPWARRRRVPLRGMPQDISRLEEVLSDVSILNCSVSAENVLEVIEEARKLYGVLPFPWRDVADTLLFKTCPSLGRRFEEIERLLEELEVPSGRAKRFLELLGEKNDKDKATGRPEKTKKGSEG